jgi:GNAT superfamily N-acetyltransferase
MQSRFRGFSMAIELKKAKRNHLSLIHKLQVESFKILLEKYQDFSTNPGAENLNRIETRFDQPQTTYYLIIYNGQTIGAIRVIDSKDNNSCRISPMFIHPDYQNKSLGQEAVYELEKIYADIETWILDTILQEKKLCHFYEKLGYIDTGKRDKIKEGMDIIYYRKRKNLDSI